MTVFNSGDTLDALYLQMVKSLLANGVEVEKMDNTIDNDEGKYIKELYSCIIEIQDPMRGILNIQERAYNPAFAIAETIWNITGDTDCWLIKYNQLYEYYFDGKNNLNSGYGNRIFKWDSNTNQFENVVNRLKEESTTQHADIIIFNPLHDLKNPRFVPCITKIKFRIRNKELHMSTCMRAQDIWRGFPYDINLLLTLFQLMLNRLKQETEFSDLKMGTYVHYCDVLRLYKRNYDAAQRLIKNVSDIHPDGTEIINLNGQCDFEALQEYKKIIKKFALTPASDLNIRKKNYLAQIKNYPEYWQNSIKTCLAYCLAKNSNYDDVRIIVNSITNSYQKRFIEWCKFYKKVDLK
jgi:thymidylate synthase